MQLGILGTGKVALLLAGAWQQAGHTIVLGSRDPQAKHLDYVVQSLHDTVKGADIVVNALVGSASLTTLASIDPSAFGTKTVIDVANATTQNFELIYPNSSLAERIQAALPNAHVVKTLNTAAMTVLTQPTTIGASSVFLSGDDAAAKAQVAGLLRDIGWTDDEIIDLGGITTARGPEHYIVMFAQLAGALKSPNFNIRVVH